MGLSESRSFPDQELDDYQILQMFDEFYVTAPLDVKAEPPQSPEKEGDLSLEVLPGPANAKEPSQEAENADRKHANSSDQRPLATPCRARPVDADANGMEAEEPPEPGKKIVPRQDMVPNYIAGSRVHTHTLSTSPW